MPTPWTHIALSAALLTPSALVYGQGYEDLDYDTLMELVDWVDRAEVAEESADWQGVVDAHQAMLAILPDEPHFVLGRAIGHVHLDHYVEAEAALELLMAHEDPAIARAAIDWYEAIPSESTLRVVAVPSRAEIWIDGERVNQALGNVEVELAPETYAVEVRAEGFVSHVEYVTLGRREEVLVEIRLVAVPAEVYAPGFEPEEPDRILDELFLTETHEARRFNLPVFTLAALGTASAVLSNHFWQRAVDGAARYNDYDLRAVGASREDREQIRTDAETDLLLTNWTLGASTVLFTSAVAAFVYSATVERRVLVAPTASNGRWSVSVSGRF